MHEIIVCLPNGGNNEKRNDPVNFRVARAYPHRPSEIIVSVQGVSRRGEDRTLFVLPE